MSRDAHGGQALPIAGTRQTWRWLRRELRHRWPGVIGLVVVGVVGGAASVLPAYALGVLVDRVRDGAPASVVVPFAVVIGAAALVAGAATGLSTYLVARLGGRILAALRERVVARALTLPANTLEQTGRGELLSRVGADVAAISKAVSDVIPTMISSGFLGTLSVAAMLGIDWRLGLAGLIAAPLYVLALRWYLPRSAPGYALERAATAERSRLLVESMQGVRTAHAYRLEQRHLYEIDAASARARDLSVAVFRLFTRFTGRVNRAELVGLAAIVIVGFVLVRNGAGVSVGETAAAAVLFHRLFNPIGMLLYIFDEVQAAGASLSRLVGVVMLPDPGDPTGDPTAGHAGQVSPGRDRADREPADGSLELDDVRFSYDGVGDVLHGVTIRLEPGQRVALMGATGAGKSTLAAIAAGILPPSGGTARIGGVRLSELDPARLRSHVVIISQETHVFAGPLIEDLRLARPAATTAEATAALAAVGARDWVLALPDGLETVVGEGGHHLTAAQVQQLALARLVLADPTVAILDEATAEAGSLGARTLEQSALAATTGRTTLVVAHRLTQAASADRVVVLDDGRIVEEGTHAELVAAGGRYTQLWHAWQARTTVTTG